VVDERAFIDTNVFVYAFDDTHPSKQRIARRVLTDERERVISTQVMLEFCSVARRKLGMRWGTIGQALTSMMALPYIVADGTLVADGVDLASRHSLSVWDGAIVAAAVAAGCSILVSEDMSAGAVLEGVRIENPFAHASGE